MSIWNVHIPQSKIPHCTVDPQGPGGKTTLYDDRKTKGGLLSIDVAGGLLPKTQFAWAGYVYTVSTATYGPYTTLYNSLRDVPNCQSDTKVPVPHGSIDILATNTGKPATSDEAQRNISVSTTGIRISVPVYAQVSDYIPTYPEQITAQQVAGLNGLKEMPSSMIRLLSTTTQMIYHRDPDAGCVFVPTQGLCMAPGVAPPRYTRKPASSETQLMRSGFSNDKSLLILPNNRGTTRAMCLKVTQLDESTAGTDPKEQNNAIPVVVKNRDGKQLNLHEATSEHTEGGVHISIQMVMIGATIALGLFGIFVGLPLGSLYTDATPYVVTILSLGISFVFGLTLAGSTSFIGRSKIVAESSSPIMSSILFIELLITLIATIAISLTQMSLGDKMSILVYFLLGSVTVMILTFGPYVTQTSKSTYSEHYQTYPLYFDRVLSMLKLIAPFTIILFFSGSIQSMVFSQSNPSLSPIINMVFSPEHLYGPPTTQPRPFNGTDASLLKALLWFYSPSDPMAPVDFAQHPVGSVQSSLTSLKGKGVDTIVAAVNKSGHTVAVDTSKSPPRLLATEDGVLPQGTDVKTLLQRGLSTMSPGYTNAWHIGISVVLMAFFATMLMIPAFTGAIAFKTDERVQENPDEKPSLSSVILDSLYAFAMPLVTFACILYTFWGTGNTTQMYILSMGPIIAFIVNCVSFTYRK